MSSVARGLTNYGDAILFHVCAASIRTLTSASTENEADELQFSVLCTGIMSLTSMPLAVWLARNHLRPMAPYGVTMGLGGLALVPVGTIALFLGNTRALEVAVGLFFVVFACIRLTVLVAEEAEAAAGNAAPAAGGSSPVADAVSTNTVAADAAPIATGDPVLTSSATMAASDNAVDADLRSLNDKFSVIAYFSRLEAWLNSSLPKPSKNSSPARTLAVLFVVGAAAGFLNGLLGTGGPPQMAAFTLLAIPKNEVRGIATTFAVLELPVRLALWIMSAGSAWAPTRDGALYAAIAASSICGFILGATLRSRADEDMVNRAMLILILVGATVLLGAARSIAVASFCAAGTLSFIGFLVFIRQRPDVYDALMIACRLRNNRGPPHAPTASAPAELAPPS